MAFSGMNAGGGRGRSRWRSGGSLSEMNVVPLVDVMLVLLIIFMVTASAMEFGLEVDVPKVKARSQSVDSAPVVAIDRNSQTFLLSRPTNINVLASELKKQFPKAEDVYVRADKNVRYEQIANVISALGEAKLNVKLVTKSENIR